MNNLEDYIVEIDKSLELLHNNFEYYKSFGSFYIMSRIREDLDNIIECVSNVRDVADDLIK